MEKTNEYAESLNRVYALYRVSTLGQVEKDDIPMQKQVCREFAQRQGWNIIREFSEKGVSGFKVSAKDRDAIQEIQQDAALGKFDILLVFMFDRLGRRDDETPFVVEWFVKNGIEVWSATEGQQRFDSHVDKLMNYIRYWQASGESLKTSIRTKTRLGQLTEEGHYTGGTVPFGYRAVDKGRVNKKNRTVFDLEINEDEAEIVRLIFHKYVVEGFGSQRICRYLHDEGIKHRDGKGFPNTSLNRIIKNIIYTGIIKNGESRSAYIDELRIIDVETYSKAQEIMRQRTQPHSEIPLNCKGRSLLVGNIYCAHCGNRLTLTTSGRLKRMPDGTIEKEVRARYQCHYNVRHPGECDGQSGYSVPKLDGIVEKVIRMKFAEITAAGLAVGVYFYSYALTLADVRREAQWLISTLEPYRELITFPVAYDLEDSSQQQLGRATLTSFCLEFCGIVAGAGYKPLLYTNPDWLSSRLDAAALNMPLWIAQWGKKPTREALMWQYSAEGKVAGIKGSVDMNEYYGEVTSVNTKDIVVVIGGREVPGKLIDGVTYVPLRIAVDAVNAARPPFEVTWDGTTATVE